jgi:hypothetical protein
VRLTPEVKRAIEYNGIPYFGIAGGTVLMGYALDDEDEMGGT